MKWILAEVATVVAEGAVGFAFRVAEAFEPSVNMVPNPMLERASCDSRGLR
jgi:hypothetical protein